MDEMTAEERAREIAARLPIFDAALRIKVERALLMFRCEENEACARVVEQYIDDEKLWDEMGSFAQRSDQLEAGLRFVTTAIRARVK